ncbi:MAG: tyrosine-type recombinase/integrase, partial [Oscillospiraceae bacterium]|nr:tyrosine-type recombinase/integrase [Oscillospiraceae bacterium]
SSLWIFFLLLQFHFTMRQEPMNPQSPTRYFAKFGRKYGIDDFHPHKLRHTSASIAILHGADIVSVSSRLGHSDTAVTLRMYAHANEESIRRAGQIVRDALKASGEI